MASFGKKKSYTDWLYTRPVVIFLGFLIVLLAYAVFQRFTVEREMYARRIAAEEERQEVLQHKTELEEKVKYLEGERGIEEEIRKHFDVAREGEQVVILVGDDTEKPEEKLAPETPKPKWYQFWR